MNKFPNKKLYKWAVYLDTAFKILSIIAFAFWVFILVGCSSLPKSVGECADLYPVEEEAEQCRVDVIKLEDSRFRKKEERAAATAAAQYCWRTYRAGYDRQNGRCVYVHGYGGVGFGVTRIL